MHIVRSTLYPVLRNRYTDRHIVPNGVAEFFVVSSNDHINEKGKHQRIHTLMKTPEPKHKSNVSRVGIRFRDRMGSLVKVLDNSQNEPECTTCHRRIKANTKAVKALGQVYHRKHFRCHGECDQRLGGQEYFLHDGKPYCGNDFMKIMGQTCKRCHNNIEYNGWVMEQKHLDDIKDVPVTKPSFSKRRSLINSLVINPTTTTATNMNDDGILCHMNCIKCSVCNYIAQPNNNDVFYSDKDDKLYCQKDFAKLKNLIVCTLCERMIEGPALTVYDQSFHPTCLICSHNNCNEVISVGDAMFMVNEKLVCEKHRPKFNLQDVHLGKDMSTEAKETKISDIASSLPDLTRCHVCYGSIYNNNKDDDSDDENSNNNIHNDISMLPMVSQSSLKSTCVEIAGKSYHGECLQCKVCGCRFTFPEPGLASIFVHKESIYCSKDFGALFMTTCDRCHLPIVKDGVTTEGKTLHSDCLRCAAQGCTKRMLAGQPVYFCLAEDGKTQLPYCRRHRLHTKQNEGECSSANCINKSLLGRPICMVNGIKYHETCVVCSVCNCDFPNGRGLYIKDHTFYCAKDYIDRYVPRCAKCNDLIVQGTMITRGNQDFHGNCISLI